MVLASSCSSKSGSDAALPGAGSGGRASGARAGSTATSNGGAGESGATPAVAGMVNAGGALAVGAGGALAVGAGGSNGLAGAVSTGSGGASSSGASSGGAGTGGTAAAAGSPNAAGTGPTSDTFEGTTLDASWTVFRPDLADIVIADGSLSITPHSGALWYQASQADLVYKLVSGNFKATTTVHARKASNRALTPAQFADVGGIMARNPSGASENYILGVVGYAEMNQLAVEHKSTTNGKSVYGEVAFSADAEFRLCRVGSTFTIYYRHPGDTSWGPAFEPFERPDLPATVQVGAIAYTGAAAPDFVAIFDSFSFEPLGAGCTQ